MADRRCVGTRAVHAWHLDWRTSASTTSRRFRAYVWGPGNTVLLLDSNQTSYYQSGSLFEFTLRLPATIADAISVTAGVNERYLWVDSLCIVRDNDHDRAYYLSVMDKIYAHAKLTITNAAGADARDGLPGVRPGTRSAAQQPFTGPRGRQLIRSLQPVPNGERTNYLGESAWGTRAWTLQERVFSRRALIFTPELVYWECQTATWREDGNWETVHPPLFREEDVLEGVDLRAMIKYPENREVTFESSFRKLVQHYSQRHLSVFSDHLHAFDGVAKILSHKYGQQFHWGLPIRYFVDALLWQAHGDRVVRVEGQHLLVDSATNSSHKVPLPSWSWAGWLCYVPWEECGSPLRPNDGAELQIFVLNDVLDVVKLDVGDLES